MLQYEALVPAVLLKRYKRFLGDVHLGDPAAAAASAAMAAAAAGEASQPPTVVHVPNTGSMCGLLDALPAPALLSVSADPKRKYAHTLEALQVEVRFACCCCGRSLVCGCTLKRRGVPHWLPCCAAQKTAPQGAWVCAHSAKANSMARFLLEARALPHLPPYTRIQQVLQPGTLRVLVLAASPSSRWDPACALPTPALPWPASTTLRPPVSPSHSSCWQEVKFGADGKSRVDFVLHNEAGGSSSNTGSTEASSSPAPAKRKRGGGAAAVTPASTSCCYLEVKASTLAEDRPGVSAGQKGACKAAGLLPVGTVAAPAWSGGAPAGRPVLATTGTLPCSLRAAGASRCSPTA